MANVVAGERAGRRIGPAATADAARGRRLLPPLHVAAFWLAFALVNAWFTGWTLYEITVRGWAANDWRVLIDGISAADPYGQTLYRWSPLLVEPLALLTTMPFGAWAALHVIAALALPTWPMRLLVLVSWPFWQDVSTGNVMVFVLLAAAWAVRGSRIAQVAFLGLTLLIPRPLMLPIAGWLLWRHPRLRVPALAVTAVYLLAVVAVDPELAWFHKLLASSADIGNDYNFGPSAIIGPAWIPIGIALAVALTWRGRPGWAALVVSPYWLAYYWMMPFLDLSLRGSAAGEGERTGPDSEVVIRDPQAARVP